MGDEKRDQLLLEILDRLARLETKFDEQVDIKHTAREALDKANHNDRRLIELERRMDQHDDKWKVDRSEKWGLWVAIIAGIFTLGASLISIFL